MKVIFIFITIVYGTAIMTAIVRVHLLHLMNAEWRQVAADQLGL